MNDTTIAAQVARMHASTDATQADAAASPFAREQAALGFAGVPAGVAAPGVRVPDADVLDVDGQPRKLFDVLEGRRAVIVLYRGAWCPYCNLTLSTYQRVLLPQLRTRGVSLVAISPQNPDGSLTMREKHSLEFAVVSDPGNAVARALGVLTAPSDDVREAQLDGGLDLTQVNADATTELPMPTTVVVDAAGVIRWIDVHPDYSSRSEPAEIVAAVDGLPGGTP